MPSSLEAFRQEVRAFAQRECPPNIRAVVAAGGKLTKHDYLTWQQKLRARLGCPYVAGRLRRYGLGFKATHGV